MDSTGYIERREQIETYFDRTAAKAWERLTSTAPVGRIRATVRAGRDQMRGTLLSWLPQDMRGLRLLDAGCGTGALAMEAAARGAEVVAIDLSPTLVKLAAERYAQLPQAGTGRVQFLSGDMLADSLGRFDHVVAMDSLIHYDVPHMVEAMQRLGARTQASILFTFAPRTPALAAMHALGRLFPRGDRSPSLTPVSEPVLRAGLAQGLGPLGWREGRTLRIHSGFYTSQAWEWHV
ncbi:MAG: magnesium protoporphyrin O-methyltransferase [Pseudomonadota bacterium]|jgi:magnesium-protoporphyrin O-methyltransferase